MIKKIFLLSLAATSLTTLVLPLQVKAAEYQDYVNYRDCRAHNSKSYCSRYDRTGSRSRRRTGEYWRENGGYHDYYSPRRRKHHGRRRWHRKYDRRIFPKGFFKRVLKDTFRDLEYRTRSEDEDYYYERGYSIPKRRRLRRLPPCFRVYDEKYIINICD